MSKSERAALAQSTSFCTVGAPLTPIAPTSSPFTLMGNPPPHAATRESVGIPAKSDGSLWIKSKKSCVETPSRAVYALFCAISMVGIGAPSIRLKALRLPPSSRIVTFSATPSSVAFATAALIIFCASSKEMLCFFTTLAMTPSSIRYLLRVDHPRTSPTASAFPVPQNHLAEIRNCDFVCVSSGIHSAIDGKIRPRNVGGLRTGNERDHRSDLFDTSIAVERCGGLLRHRPIARRRIQVRVDRSRLDVVDRNSAAPKLSGQGLSEHLDSSFRGRVGHKTGRHGTLAD